MKKPDRLLQAARIFQGSLFAIVGIVICHENLSEGMIIAGIGIILLNQGLD